MKRYGLIYSNAADAERVPAYLPDNYEVLHSELDMSLAPAGGLNQKRWTVIAGEDVAGWTLDGYVIPRLASGLIFGEEIDLSHPIMKRVPVRAPQLADGKP